MTPAQRRVLEILRWESDPASVERAEAFWRAALRDTPVFCTACGASGYQPVEDPLQLCGGVSPEGGATHRRCEKCHGTGRIHDPAAVVEWWLAQADMITMAGEDVLLYRVPAMRMLVWWEEAGHEIDSCPAPAAIDALLVALSRIPQACSKCEGRKRVPFEPHWTMGPDCGVGGTTYGSPLCEHCRGTGHEPCPRCLGIGRVQPFASRMDTTDCALCSGTGSLGIVPGICRTCGKPSEAHHVEGLVYRTPAGTTVVNVLRCYRRNNVDEWTYVERPSPLASPWPRTESR